MGFLDEAVITVISGDGGKGCVSFRKEKYIPKGGPDGGDGGNGGSVRIHATKTLHSLIDFSSQRRRKAPNGEPGKGKNQTGKNGADITLVVPVGTVVQDFYTNEILCDLVRDEQEMLLLLGGTGGKGNRHFATSTRQAPKISQPGLPGQEKKVRLSLRFLAEIGLIGLPNAGKSTLLARLSMAHPKIDDYPFTTLVPNLGVMKFEDETAVTIADIPGLIQGASQGKGLGHRFLKHIERTHLLLHLLDITYNAKKDVLEDFDIVMEEIQSYNPLLARKPQMVVVNKMDLYKPGHRHLKELRNALQKRGVTAVAVSAKNGNGMDNLKKAIADFCMPFKSNPKKQTLHEN